MLVQGFDVPNLNSVFFVVAKKALTGVLQSVMRPLTAVPGKPISRVFVPVMIPPTASSTDPVKFFTKENGANRLYGAIVAIVASQKGMSTRGGPTGVANSVNAAVVESILILMIVNVAISQLYNVLFPRSGL